MSLVPMRPILDATDKYSYAQGAFNVNAVEQAKAVIDIHDLFRSPPSSRVRTSPTAS